MGGDHYRINPFTGEFSELLAEQAFRRHDRATAVRYLRITLAVSAFFFLVFGLIDYVDLGNSLGFWAILVARILTAGCAVALIVALRQRPELADDGRAATVVIALGYSVYMLTVFLRPEDLQGHANAMLIMLVGTYLFIPNRLILAAGVGLYGSALFFFGVGVFGLAWDAGLRLVLLFALTNSLCGLAAYRFSVLRRESFALLSEEQRVVERLQGEMLTRTRLEGELKRLAATDDLTGLNNRRHFLDLANHELRRLHRSGGLLSVCLLDLDRFKAINDSYGHAVGDEALRQVAAACVGVLRESDIIGRFGGEEFTIALPGSDLRQAERIAERLRARIAALRVPTSTGELALTVTIGVAGCLRTDASIEEALAEADLALYRGKRAGRDRVVLQQRPPPPCASDKAPAGS